MNNAWKRTYVQGFIGYWKSRLSRWLKRLQIGLMDLSSRNWLKSLSINWLPLNVNHNCRALLHSSIVPRVRASLSSHLFGLSSILKKRDSRFVTNTCFKIVPYSFQWRFIEQNPFQKIWEFPPTSSLSDEGSHGYPYWKLERFSKAPNIVLCFNIVLHVSCGPVFVAVIPIVV